jgi:4-amino-4-deoxy-L-arabinose transferase-like glycosyltransferase
MTQELTRKRTTFSGGTRALTTRTPWHRLALAAILVLSAFLNLFRLTNEGYGNSYYAAGVKNMLTSWHNFFFVSFDAGFVSIDKPPLGLWIQAASAKLFGFSGLSLLLPQALAGVLSVALLYHLVRRAFGPVAGLIAALVLAVTPIVVVTSRNNTADMLLVLTVLVAAWAVIRAAEAASLRWLLLCAVVVGLGFNIKMMQAFLVLPAFYLLYLLAAPVSWRRRFVHLSLATLVLVVVSLSWAVAVDLTPADQRPYVGSSQHNSALELASGYNGLSRLLGRGNEFINSNGGFNNLGSASDSQSAQGFGPGGGGGPGGVGENGEKGPLRLLDQQLAGQIGWLLPLSVVGLLAASWQRRLRMPVDRRQGSLVLWGMWLLTMVGFFSIAGMFHRYYLVMLAPAIAALVGIGVVALWKDYRGPGRRGWLLPLVVPVGMAIVQDYVLSAYEGWPLWLVPGISGLCLLAAGVLVVARLGKKGIPARTSSNLLAAVVAVGMLSLLIAPTAWAAYSVGQGVGGLPAAGPQPAQGQGGPGGPGGPPGGGPPRGGPGREADPALVEYLQANKGDTEYLVATTDAHGASSIILNTDERVIDLKGFEGHDPVFSAGELAGLVDEGAVRLFLISEGGPGGDSQNESVGWVQDNCAQVPQEDWQSPEAEGQGGPQGRAQALYDCGMVGR